MGDIVPIRKANPGNGVREALQRYFEGREFHRYLIAHQHLECPNAPLSETDHFLAWLAAEGFMVRPE